MDENTLLTVHVNKEVVISAVDCNSPNLCRTNQEFDVNDVYDIYSVFVFYL